MSRKWYQPSWKAQYNMQLQKNMCHYASFTIFQVKKGVRSSLASISVFKSMDNNGLTGVKESDNMIAEKLDGQKTTLVE